MSMATPGRRKAASFAVRAVVAITLSVMLSVSGAAAWSPAGVAADSSSDIPGVPLTPGVVVGPLGGNIYDVVYSLDVAPGAVVLASLTGSSGTDFDLYLFDSSATTVVTNQGVVARSTGPTARNRSPTGRRSAGVSTSTSTRRRQPLGRTHWSSR